MMNNLIILVIYVNVSGLTRNQTEELMYENINYYEDEKIDNNYIKYIHIPSNVSKVECVYPVFSNVAEINNVINKITKILKEGNKEKYEHNLKNYLRLLKINKILNNGKK